MKLCIVTAYDRQYCALGDIAAASIIDGDGLLADS
jgi:hypothetical protein